ncbi:VIT1/CCC1 transporter family protein [Actinomyces culturomici]|uniref:VIT1/CCC1 transporter family protein n=1 Tax=Actinomyces culturomici TaxID=1926276 RepID=UPI000E206F40|nr:VIT family protein [Actinomyces culturomici]
MSMLTRTPGPAGATPRSEPEKKQSIATRLNWLRAGVLGANDGIVSISGLLVGVAAADPTNTKAIAIAGVAGIISAALSMSVGEYVSVSTQRDTERQLVRTQQALLDSDPVGQERRLADLWVDRGVSEETAACVAKELSAYDALDAHLTTEHNIDPDDLTNPWAAAFSSFVAFLVGSLLPLATMLLFPPSIRIPETFAAVLVALALTGWVSATLGEAPRGRAVARLLIGGAVAMALTYGVGHLFGVNV